MTSSHIFWEISTVNNFASAVAEVRPYDGTAAVSACIVYLQYLLSCSVF